MHGTDQHGVVSPAVPGVEWTGHQPLQQRHAQAKGSSQLGLDHWAQLTGVSSQHYLGRGGGRVTHSCPVAADSRALALTCPSLSEMRLMGIRDSGSVAWPASSRKTWVKCPTLRGGNGGRGGGGNDESSQGVCVCMTVGGQQSSLTASRCCGTWLRWSRCSQRSCEKTPGECLPLPLSTLLIPPVWTEGEKRKRKNPNITFRTLAVI